MHSPLAISSSNPREDAPEKREDWLAWQRAMSEGWNIASAVVKPFASALDSFKTPSGTESNFYFSPLYLFKKITQSSTTN